MEQIGAYCEKYKLDDSAKNELKLMFDAEILRVFYNNASKSVTIKEKSEKTGAICIGKIKKNGSNCTFKAKEGSEFCARHGNTSSSPKSTTSSGSKPRAKKETVSKCSAIASSGKACCQLGTIKPDGTDRWYCKKHSKNYADYKVVENEEETDHEIISDDGM